MFGLTVHKLLKPFSFASWLAGQKIDSTDSTTTRDTPSCRSTDPDSVTKHFISHYHKAEVMVQKHSAHVVKRAQVGREW